MLFNVSGLIQEGIGATRRHQVDGVLRVAGREPEEISGEVEFLRTKTGVLVRAHLNLQESEICSRCLRPLRDTVSIRFEEEFQAVPDRDERARPGEEIDDDAFRIDENHMLDLTEAVRQYREASAIMQPLCLPDCRGLCPRCGQDLNTGACNCAAALVDDRWAGLESLLSPNREGKD